MEDLHDFYAKKSSSEELPIADRHWELARARHATTEVAPVTKEELDKATKPCLNVGHSSVQDWMVSRSRD